jgi:CBS domain-containing protein
MKTVIQILQAKGDEVCTVEPQVSVFDALKLMAENDIGALVVVEAEKVVGILSERDYARKMILKDRLSRDTPVRKVMTERVITVEPATTIEVCMNLMTYRRIRHLPVIENNRLIGIISMGDIMKAITLRPMHLIEYRENCFAGK